MKIKNLMAVAILAPLLILSLAAKACTCPIPEYLEKIGTLFIDKDGNFTLVEKPITFADAIFMHTNESLGKIRYGKLSTCLYVTEDGTKKFALLQGAATKVAAIAVNSETWKTIKNNRYDCFCNNVEACQFNLYRLIK